MARYILEKLFLTENGSGSGEILLAAATKMQYLWLIVVNIVSK